MNPANILDIRYYGSSIAPRHFTNAYELLKTNENAAIYRRGYNFYVSILFNRVFNVETDVLRVALTFGSRPKQDITRIKLVLRPNQKLPNDPNQWGIALERIDANKDNTSYVMVEIHIAANAPVGVWRCTALTNIRNIPKIKNELTASNDFYVLFNPWSNADSVYLEDEKERNEYVLNDTGKIWLGTSWNPYGREWYFGQFEAIALTASVYLLDKSTLSPEERGDPVLVTRALSAIVNSDDDNGLLVANFNGNFSGGTPPGLWTGSLPILEEYYNSGGVPVKYGQCWVFSAVTVTICRALGIPCRSTTVYGAGQGSTNIIRNYDAFGNLTDDNNPNDTLWSFHAWNEVWLTRKNFSGWQVIDATPLRRSEGIMRCGPAAVEAVRQGHRDYQYDTDFVIDVLNAEIRNVVLDDNSELGEYQLPRSGYRAARSIVTKAIGSDDLLNVTSSYKDREELNVDDNEQVTYRIITNRVPYGETLTVTVEVTNNSGSAKNIWSVLAGKSVHYNGKLVSVIDQRQDHFSVRRGEVVALPPLSIPASKYIPTLVDQGFIKLYAFARVEEDGNNGKPWAEEEDFVFNQPVMAVTSEKLYYNVGDTVDVNVSFRNPVNVTLTECSFMVDGPSHRISKRQTFKDVGPLEQVNIPVTFTAGERVGPRRIYVNFTSRQLPYVGGSELIYIRAK